MFNNNIKKNKGFSLIEILISIGIFTLITVVAIGSFMSTSNSAKKSKALRIAMDNVNFAMDNITRELRVGSNYNDNSPKSQISFTPYDLSVPKRYFYLNPVTKSIEKCDLMISLSSCSPLNSPEVSITKLEFTIYDDFNVGTDTQPSVYIEIAGEVDLRGVKESFDLHTLASQRNSE